MLIKFLYDIWKTTLILKTHVNIQWLYLSFLANRRNKKKEKRKRNHLSITKFEYSTGSKQPQLNCERLKKKKKVTIKFKVRSEYIRLIRNYNITCEHYQEAWYVY